MKFYYNNSQFVVIKDESATWNPYFVYLKYIKVDGETWHKARRLVARLETLKDCLAWLAEWNG